jgi:ferredoxin
LGYPSDKALELMGGVKSTPELALRFVVSNENVTLALSGMSTMEQLEQNAQTVSTAGRLTREDHRRIEAAVQERKKLAGLYCTGCNYCMPCPEGVDIAANFEILNADRIFGLTEHARARYASLGGKAALCRQCGKCVDMCPQYLDIPARLGEAVALLDERSGSVAGWSELRGVSRGTSGTLDLSLRYYLKNFTANDYAKVAVEMHSHREDQIAPDRFGFSKLKGYGRRHKDLTVSMLPPVETLSLGSLIRFYGSHTLEHLYHVVTAAVEAEKISRRGRRPTIHVPGPVHPAHAGEKPLQGHSFDFIVSYDHANLFVWVEVEDDLARTIDKAEGDRFNADTLRLFMDAREPKDLGRGGYGQGALHITFSPLTRDSGEVRVFVSNDKEVCTSCRHTEFGYVVDCTIPWSAFGRDKDRPEIMGFDIAQVSFDAEGKREVRLSWSGKEGQEEDTARLGALLLP